MLGATVMLLTAFSQGPAVGEPFPTFIFPPVSGTERWFGPMEFEGKPALIHVFASW